MKEKIETSDFWNDLFEGYIEPSTKELKDAIDILIEWKEKLEEDDKIEYI